MNDVVLNDGDRTTIILLLGALMGAYLYLGRNDFPVRKGPYVALLTKLGVANPEQYWPARWETTDAV